MSFKDLIDRISPKLRGIVYKIHKNFPSFLQDDLYQDAVLHLWVNFKEGKLADKTDSYVLQGCFFYLKNYLRTLQNKTSLLTSNMPDPDVDSEFNDIASSENETIPEEVLDVDNMMESVFNKVLDRKEKEIIFFYLQGWTTREIAKRLGLSHVSIVKSENKIREKCKKFKNSL